MATIPDSTKSGNRSDKEPAGVKQLLERKQGLFRMNMMGKRVNFTCRSVISDPNIGAGEIGSDRRQGADPEPITPWNVRSCARPSSTGPASTRSHHGAGFERADDRPARQMQQQRIAIAKRLP